MPENQKAKPVYVIKEWIIGPGMKVDTYVLHGFIFGRDNFSDIESATTSVLLTVDFINKIAETKNSFYKLS